jgi:hypothetical protein
MRWPKNSLAALEDEDRISGLDRRRHYKRILMKSVRNLDEVRAGILMKSTGTVLSVEVNAPTLPKDSLESKSIEVACSRKSW